MPHIKDLFIRFEEAAYSHTYTVSPSEHIEIDEPIVVYLLKYEEKSPLSSRVICQRLTIYIYFLLERKGSLCFHVCLFVSVSLLRMTFLSLLGTNWSTGTWGEVWINWNHIYMRILYLTEENIHSCFYKNTQMALNGKFLGSRWSLMENAKAKRIS